MKTLNINLINKSFIVFTSAFLIAWNLYLLFLSFQVNFMQNDDWVYYDNIIRLLNGNLTMNQLTAPTFYTIGILGFLWSKLFGHEALSILTTIVSIINLLLLYYILIIQLKINKFLSIVGLFLYAVIPLHVYLSIGFMTDQYAILFVLLVTILIIKFLRESNPELFVLILFISFVGFLARQYLIVFNASFFIVLLLQKKYKYALYTFGFMISLSLFYLTIFPRTTEMHEKTITLYRMFDYKLLMAYLYVGLLYISAFLFPFLSFSVFAFIKRNFSWKLLIISSLFSLALILIFHQILLNTPEVGNEFPNLVNTFTQKGFFTNSFIGNKYHFKGYYDLFKYWQLIAQLGVFFIMLGLFYLIGVIIRLRKFKFIYANNNYNLLFLIISIVLYTFLVFMSVAIYDRYVLVVILFSSIFLLKLIDIYFDNKNYYLVGITTFVFSLFLLIISYSYSSEFVYRIKISNNEAIRLQNELNLPVDHIKANRAWNLYNNVGETYKIYFSYDQESNYLKKLKIDYPLNIFIEPYIYVYEN